MATPRTYKNRLLRLAEFLEKLPREKFDLSFFTGADGLDDAPGPGCGTAGCAIGWMPNAFPRDCKYVEDSFGGITITSMDGSKDHFNLAEDFFGLSRNESSYLFTTDYYKRGRRGPKSVAKRLREFAANRPSDKKINEALTSREL